MAKSSKWAINRVKEIMYKMKTSGISYADGLENTYILAEALYAAAEEVARVAYREADDALDISECMSLSVFVKRVLDKLGR